MNMEKLKLKDCAILVGLAGVLLGACLMVAKLAPVLDAVLEMVWRG